MSSDPRCTAPPKISRVSDDAGTRGIEAVFHINVAAEPLLQVLWDPDNYAELFPDIKSHRVLDASDDQLDIEMTVDAVLKQIKYVLRRSRDADKLTITWREVAGDLKRVRGGWYIERTDNADVCRLTYRAFVAVNRFVPTRLVAATATRKLDEMVARVRNVAGRIAAQQSP